MALQPDCGSRAGRWAQHRRPQGDEESKAASRKSSCAVRVHGAQVPATLLAAVHAGVTWKSSGTRGACGWGQGEDQMALQVHPVPEADPHLVSQETGASALPVKLQHRVLHILPACPHGPSLSVPVTFLPPTQG